MSKIEPTSEARRRALIERWSDRRDAPREHYALALRGKLSVKRLPKVIKLPGRHGDGRGLILEVRSETSASWFFRYERDGRERWVGLGSAGVVTLEEARRSAERARHLLASGRDPWEVRKVDRAKAAAALDRRGRRPVLRHFGGGSEGKPARLSERGHPLQGRAGTLRNE